MLFLYEAVDEYVMSNLREYEEKTLVSAADQGDLKLEDTPEPNDEGSLSEDESKDLCSWLKETIGDRVKEVKVSTRLVDSPMALSDAMSSQMRRMMRQMGQDSGMPNEVLFEINPRHSLMINLNQQRESNRLQLLIALQAFDNSLIAAGLLEDPREMVTRMTYEILSQASEKM